MLLMCERRSSEAEERGQARLPNLRGSESCVTLCVWKGFNRKAPQGLRSSQVGKAGLPPLLRYDSSFHSARSAAKRGERNAAQVATSDAVKPDINTPKSSRPSDALGSCA